MSNRFLHFEDYHISQDKIVTDHFTRTVTEADIVSFACITADYSSVHVDRNRMAHSIYGERVAHGLLGSSLVTGILSSNAPHIIGRGVPKAYFYYFDANYRGAIKLRDTINVQWQITEKVNDPIYKGFGMVKTAFKVVNQESTSVYDGIIATLVSNEAAGDTELQLKPGTPFELTEFISDPGKIYYAEDYPVGMGRETDGRTITEADIVNFAGLTSDYNPQYVDAEFAKSSIFGERIAHPMLVFNIAFGLWMRERNQCQDAESKFAGHLYDNATFYLPVKIGDTIRCRYKVAANRVSKSKPGAGINTYALQVVNQRDEVVQEGSVLLMLPSRAK